MRIVIGAIVIGLALAGALELHNAELHHPSRSICAGPGYACWTSMTYRSSWVDPLAILIAVVGVGVGIAIIVSARTRSS